jgi:hypothetical protein
MDPSKRPGVIPVLVTGIQRSANADARGWMDTGDKPRYDRGFEMLAS